MRNIWILLVSFVFTIFMSPKNSLMLFGIIRHDIDIEQYSELGNKSEFSCVGRYSESIESNDFATGVLIAPTWVLTASHFPQVQSFWKFGNDLYATKRIINHPKLKPGSEETQWMGYDLALIELDKPVIHTSPAKRYYGKNELDQTITKVGYGYIGNGITGMNDPRKQEKLGGQNIIDAIGGTFEGRQFSTDVMVCDFDNPDDTQSNHFGSPIPLDLEIGGSKGDSGGGIFMRENGQEYLVGIVSGALNRQIKYGSVMALARVSSANEWIDSIIEED